LHSAAERQSNAVCGSALTGEGTQQLLAALDRKVSGAARIVALELDSADGARLAWLYRHGTVLERRDANGRTHLKVALPPAEHRRLHRDLPAGSILEAQRENPPGER
jgi:GTP-binding protein HflX